MVTPHDATTVVELYERATAQLAAGDAAAAAAAFERVFRLDPDGPLAPDALMRAAEAQEQRGDREAAVARLEQLVRRFRSHGLAREALVRSIRLHAFLGQWQPAGIAAELLISRYRDLRPFESVIAYGGRALSLVAVNDADGAAYYVDKGRTVVEAERLDAAGRLPRDLAPLFFALGEVRRLRAGKIQFVPVPTDFATQLERRCQLLLDAQSAYSDTMRAYDAHWSAMAGYRVGELYQSLHDDLMGIPPPPTADSVERKQLFEGAMRLRYSILLDKALTMMEHTLSMAMRTGERSVWVLRAEEAKRMIERRIRLEQAAIDRLPYTRDQLKAALERLAEPKR